MPAALRAFVLAVLVALGFATPAILVSGGPAVAQKSFVRESLASDAVRLETSIKGRTKVQGLAMDRLRRDVEAAQARSDWPTVADLAQKMIALDPKDWSAWNRFARAWIETAPSDNYSGAYTHQSEATAAAYVAYQRASAKADEAASLATLGLVYARREMWRSALDSYKASLQVAEVASVRAIHTDLRQKYGFRLTDYKVDNDAASPRVCFEFSEDLARGKIDWSSYVAVTGMANPAVTAEASHLCVDGLEHGKRYGMVVRQGVPSVVGEDLLAAADYDIYVKDRSPQVRFTGRNYVLPRTGQEGLPVVTVNTSSVKVEVYRIGDRNLQSKLRGEEFLKSIDGYQSKKLADEEGVKVWTGSMDIKSELNRDVTTAFPVLEAVGKLEAGLYVMTAIAASDKPDDYDNRATQWFIVSDLGLTALSGQGGVNVLVRSLASADPVVGAEVRLVARNNEILATVKSDQDGVAKFPPGLARGRGGAAPGLVVATDGRGDYGFLDLAGQAFDLTDRGVKGRNAPAGLDAFLFTERGVYRSGETAYVTAILRDVKGAAAAGVPLTLIAKRPDGVEYRRQVVEDQGDGGRAWSLPLISGLPTGTWHVEAYADPKLPAIGDVTFLLEDYVPDRVELSLKPASPVLHAGEPAVIAVSARYLYGAAGADLDVAGEISVDVADKTTVPGLEAWTVGLDDEPFEAINHELEETAKTDEKGEASVTVNLPSFTTSRPVVAKITLRVSETGGRAVERTVTLPVLPSGTVIAARKRFDDNALSEGSTAEFDIAVATPDGERKAARGLTWELAKVNRRWQWYRTEGAWDYELIKTTRRIADGRVDVGAGEPGRIAVPVEWGAYRLDVRDATGAHTSISFSVGWGGSDKVDTPDVLDVRLDRSAYGDGDELKVRLEPRFAGKATVLVVSDAVQTIRTLDVSPSGSTLSIPVRADWGAGAYVVALAHRPLDVAAHRMPGRAIGVAWFGIGAEGRRIGIDLATPDLQRPRGSLTIPVRLAGLAPGETAHVVVSAVDVGILNLTRYETPNPDEYVFGQRQLATELRDLYGYLIDGMQGSRGAISSGGDAAPKSEAAPPKEEPLARYSGVVRVDQDGTASVTFELPAFNGTVRVAAIAWSAGKVGHAQKDVIVRDPVVVQATLPRFMAIGDRSRFHMAVDNVEAPAGDYVVDLDIHGPIVVPADALRSTMTLARSGRTQITIPVTAAGAGTAVVDVRLTGNGLDLRQSLIVRVQPATPAIYRRTVRPLAAGGGAITLSSDVLGDFVAGTGTLSVTVAPQGAFDVPALLKSLDRYPYGCTEQIVSRAMPLLYVNRLATEEQLAMDEKIDQRIRDAIDKVLTRQDSNGTFGLWSPGGENVWLDAFVTDFLTRAREKNIPVPRQGFDLALDHLRNFLANTDGEKDPEDIAYAAYVLARNGRPVIGDLRYLVDTKLASFTRPLSRAQIAAAFAMLGDRGRAEQVFAAAQELLQSQRTDRQYRSDYGSALRDGAGIIAMMAENGFGSATYQRASLVVEEVRNRTTYTSTQENAWMVVAAHAMLKDTEKLTLSVDGAPHTGALYRTFRGLALDGHPVAIANTSATPAQIVLTASGHPIQPEPALSAGYQIERTYHKMDGTKVDVSKVRQTDRFVVVLKVTEEKALDADLILVDYLPAGFEIDNPNLVKSGETDGFSWLESSVEPIHTEYRDDRFVAAIDRRDTQSAFFHVAYVVRAVAPGSYIHPPAVIEDMYRPERFGRTGYGSLEVTPAR